jgi:hypothetical protein
VGSTGAKTKLVKNPYDYKSKSLIGTVPAKPTFSLACLLNGGTREEDGLGGEFRDESSGGALSELKSGS